MAAESNIDAAYEDDPEKGGMPRLKRLLTIIEYIKYFFRLLYQSRISLISAVAGIFFFVFAIQTRDLFLEVRSSAWPERIYWSVFYFFLIFAWLLPVYFSAIYMIEWADRQPKMQDLAGQVAQTKTAEYMRKLVPLILVMSCLAALAWSQYATRNEFNTLYDEIRAKGDATYTLLPIPNTALLIQATMLAAVLFVSSRAELAFEGQLTRTYFYFSIGMAAIVVAAWFLWLSPQKELASYLDTEEKSGFLVLGDLPLLQWLRLCFPFFVALLWIFFYAVIFRIRHKFPDREDVIIPTIAVTLAGLFFLLFINPVWITHYAERALLLPVVLGVWVPFFSVLSIASARFRFPLVISFLFGLAILAMTNDSHIVTPKGQAAREQLKLDTALDTWKKANNCANAADGAGCPPLVLIAAQGGASRSAFYTGSVLSHIVDENGVGSMKRVFAMSGVSGGSVGFAFFSAALIDHAGLKTGSPCRTLAELSAHQNGAYLNITGFQNWFGSPFYHAVRKDWLSQSLGLTEYEDPPSKKPYNTSWRNCLQVLTSGDFLSPVFLRLSGIDFLGLNRVLQNVDEGFGADRGSVLETAWEEQYKRIVGRDTLAANFLDFLPDPSSANEWRPLLLLNATSAATGRRVIASHLYPWYCDGNGWKRRLFNDAYDVHEIFSAKGARYKNDDCTCVMLSGGQRYVLQCKNSRPEHDIKLSTAASLSSRFPVISPQADLMLQDGSETVLARVVDGGYFENFGATSLFDLVTAIKWLQGELPIHVILITNDPTFEHGDCLEGRITKKDGDALKQVIEDQPNKLPVEAGDEFLSGFRSIFNAVLQTRTARGANAAINLYKLQWTFNKVTFTHIGVNQLGIRDISMSWWLSYPVQLYLNRQISENHSNFVEIRAKLH
jgi:hypothetical protein